MNGTVKKVFMLIGVLVGALLAWQLVFNDGGILKTGYNTLANGVNKQYEKVAGSGTKLVPTWGSNASPAYSTDTDGKTLNDTQGAGNK